VEVNYSVLDKVHVLQIWLNVSILSHLALMVPVLGNDQ
jgi:hypothetical protein